MAAPVAIANTDTETDRVLHVFFEEQVGRVPDAIAVDIPGDVTRERVTVTYRQLACRSREIERRLQPIVKGECLVALLLPRTSADAYAAQLGVLSAGGAYLPLDPALPDARLADVVADADPVALVTDADGAARAAALGLDPARVLDVSNDAAALEAPARPSPPWLSPRTLAYVIYTSGTTGRPKGVMIEHRAIANLIASDVDAFGLAPGDRVVQSSSHGYDSSVEEIWLALATGATVVVADDEVVRSGPDVLSWLERERVTMWCPSPTLLRATGCRRPADTPPRVRIVYVGGEPMPPDVVSVWAPGRRLVNGYGPTECAVVATRADMEAGRAVSIGRPIPGNCAWVLDGTDDALVEVAPGGRGELCLGGAGLARGYWRAPDLTDARFVDHPRFGRLYRTGDVASRAPAGELYCHGRRDSQVKIRGHRVELEDIESHVAQLLGVRAVACTLAGHTLVALVVPADPDNPPSAELLAGATANELPSHMVPSRFAMVGALPMTAGGKLDRPALAPLAAAALAGVGGHARAAQPPRTRLEALVAACVERVLACPGAPALDADFFDALGTDSLGAAELVSTLREHDETAGVTVRDVYAAPTVRSLAARIGRDAAAGDAPARQPARDEADAPARPSGSGLDAGRGVSPGVTTALHAIYLATTFTATAAAGAAVAVVVLPWLLLRFGLVPFLAVAPVLAAAVFATYAVVNTATAIATKWRVIGRYTVRAEPMWGGFYLRHWIVQRAVCRMPWWLVEGTEFQVMLLRALGARVGRRVHLHRGVDVATGGWDLMTIGDDVTLGQDASLRAVEVEAGRITAGPIVIGDEATIEVRAGVGPHTRMGRGATLTALSSLAPHAVIPAGERWAGVPAGPAGSSPARAGVTRAARQLSPVAHGLCLVGARIGVAALTAVPASLIAIALAWAHGAEAPDVLAWLAAPVWTADAVVTLTILAVAPLPITLVLEALLARVLGPIAPGVISRWSPEYVRVWVKGLLVDRAGPWLSGALAWRTWLNLAGAHIGPSAEVSTVIDVVPEQLEVGEGTFLTDGIYLGGPRVDRGAVTMAPTTLGRRVFIGNHAVVPCGQHLPDDVLVGVCTVADDTRLEPGSAWFGHPAFVLARRPDEMDAAAFQPTMPRYAARLFFEAARFLLPVLPLLVAVFWYGALAGAAPRLSPAVFYGVMAPLVTASAAAALAAFVFLLKWTLLGRVKPGRHEFWSCWCFRWDLLYVAWQQLARPVLAGLEGTLLLAWYLRAMGARIGRRVMLGRGFAQVVDPDMLQFDDDATVRGLLQAHTFEGRVLKIDRVHVGRGATVGSQALLFYGTDVGEGTRVAPHSVVMKRERLPAGREYEGCPTRLMASGVRLTA